MSDTTIDAIITKLRAGKDPDTGELHITEQEAKSALYDLILKEVVGEDSKVYRPDDLHKLSPEMQKAITMTITSDNRLRATQRKKLKDLFE